MTLFSGCRRVSLQARGTRLATGKSRCAVLAGVMLAVDLVPHVSLSVCLSVCLSVSLSPDMSNIYSALKDKPRLQSRETEKEISEN